MELRQLRYFCSVVRTGSFTKAAEEEGIAQPSLSQQVRRLEESLGTDLLIRLGRSVRLTPAGSLFYPYAQDIIKQAKQASSRVRHLGTEVKGPLRVGVIPTVLPYFIAPRLPEFSQMYPDVEVVLTEDLTNRLVQGLESCDLDLIVVSLPLKGADFVCSAILQDPLVLVTSEDHRFASIPSPPAQDLSGERLLLLKEGHCFREDMLTACKHGRAEVAPTFESDHFGSIFPMVAAGAGVSIAPKMAADHAKDCSIIPLAKPQFRRIGFARLKGGENFEPMAAFTKWLRTLAAERKL